MPNSVIEVRDLSKRYFIKTERLRYLALRDVLANSVKNLFRPGRKKKSLQQDFWALKNISFSMKKGEIVGIIGRNGAGKSTLLKIISKITYPTQGEVRLWGRVGSLLEVGTGFHSELTGRENIYFNGSILGMKKKEIKKKFAEIVDFSGVEKFLDLPVKRYSSGMIVRLAFSVAAHLEPEILLVDEVLAVGDTMFQKKCLGKMQEVSRGGRTVLFVSHNMQAIRGLCNRVILLDEGKIAQDADSATVISQYLDKNLHHGARVSEKELQEKIEVASKSDRLTMRLKEISLRDEKGSLRTSFSSAESITVNITYECLETVRDLRITAQVVNDENIVVLTTQNIDNAKELEHYQKKPGIYQSSFVIPSNLFGDNHLYLSLHLEHPTISHIFVNKILGFEVEFQGYSNVQLGKIGKSFIRPKLEWETEFLHNNSG